MNDRLPTFRTAHTRPWTALPAAIAIVAMLAGCGGEDDLLTLEVGYIPIAECQQLYVAKEMGFLEREGLNLELVSMAGGAKILTALNAGELDVGFSNIVSLVLVNTNSEAKVRSVFGATYETKENQNHALVIQKDREGDTPADRLRGSRIGINTNKNIEELVTRKYLASIGLDESDVEFIEVPFPRMLPALESGSIDAASIVEPFIAIAREDMSESVDVMANHYLATSEKRAVATYVTAQDVIDEKGDAIAAFVRAMNAATDFIRDNDVEARKIIGQYTRMDPNLLTQIGLPAFEKRLDKADLAQVTEDMVAQSFLPATTSIDFDELIHISEQ